MAKIYSHSQGKAKGSVGLTTYRSVRGRVIESEKVAPWNPNEDARGRATRWNPRTALLGIISLFCSFHASSIANSFNRTKYGSARNMFMRLNYASLKNAFAQLATAYAASRQAPSIDEIEAALAEYATANPHAVYRIKKAGYPITFLSGEWNDADDPIAPAVVMGANPNVNAQYQLIKVVVMGSSLNANLKVFAGGVQLSGSMVVAAGADVAEFTPTVAPIIVGTKQAEIRQGSLSLYSFEIEGDPREYCVLSGSVSPEGSGEILGTGEFLKGSSVQVTAVPAMGYGFKEWEDGSTENPRTIVLSEDKAIAATMVGSVKLTLSANTGGSVSPEGETEHQYGDTVRITATPNSGWEFLKWSDNNMQNPRDLVLTEDKSLTASFQEE